MTATPTVIPPGTRIDGRVECSHDLVVEGTVEGAVRVEGTLTVARGAVVEAAVRARAAQIYGDLIGNLVCSDWAAVAPGARVVGDIRAPDVSIDAAAEVDGTVDQLPPDPESVPLVRIAARPRGGPLIRPTPPPRPVESVPS